ncbi:hypothetical protein BX285_6641 [Streptomyces sp. 1114.5]|nr:hypothetical protein BX285_6641 [Streptomyces sp. 1114.5]
MRGVVANIVVRRTRGSFRARSGSYWLGVKLGLKNVNEQRIISGDSVSPVFTVTVR